MEAKDFAYSNRVVIGVSSLTVQSFFTHIATRIRSAIKRRKENPRFLLFGRANKITHGT
jgi:hypothetical protein